ncbi:hypothetical protein [Rhizocola hellebori]|nr:hypothetical protein [Rhizocola hellebori]
MRPLADYLFAVCVALISGGSWYLAHWAMLLLAELMRRRVAPWL